MYKNFKNYNPNSLYLGKNFNEIKKYLKNTFSSTEDLGSQLILKFSNFFIVLSELLELDVYYDKFTSEINNYINNIEEIIKNNIINFEFI